MVTIQPLHFEKVTAFKERIQLLNKINEIIAELDRYPTKTEMMEYVSDELSSYYTKEEVDELLEDIDLSDYYTKQEVNTINNLINYYNITQLNATFEQINDRIISGEETLEDEIVGKQNIEISSGEYIGKSVEYAIDDLNNNYESLQGALANKQDVLTAGNGITINSNVISINQLDKLEFTDGLSFCQWLYNNYNKEIFIKYNKNIFRYYPTNDVVQDTEKRRFSYYCGYYNSPGFKDGFNQIEVIPTNGQSGNSIIFKGKNLDYVESGAVSLSSIKGLDGTVLTNNNINDYISSSGNQLKPLVIDQTNIFLVSYKYCLFYGFIIGTGNSKTSVRCSRISPSSIRNGVIQGSSTVNVVYTYVDSYIEKDIIPSSTNVLEVYYREPITEFN